MYALARKLGAVGTTLPCQFDRLFLQKQDGFRDEIATANQDRGGSRCHLLEMQLPSNDVKDACGGVGLEHKTETESRAHKTEMRANDRDESRG
jgi:hypothetical protein